LALCAALGAFGLAGAARADTVDLTYLGNGNGRVVHVALGAQSWDVFAGRLVHGASAGSGLMSGTPSSIVTFCVDLLQAHATTASPYTVSSVATLSGNMGATNLGFGKQQAIYDIYQAAAGREFTLGLDYATAFQVALWEVVYDYNATLPNHGLNASSGNFHATAPGQNSLSASITDKVQYLLGSVGIGADAHGLIGLRSGPYQDQLFAPESEIVPLPLAIWPAIGGLGLVAVIRWRRRLA
jgi:hypothetical protein